MSDPKQAERAATAVLQASMALMTPIVRWLLRSGVQYGAFSTALKRVFVDVARDELSRGGRRDTDSAISVLSGVHRKDVRALTDDATPAAPKLKAVPPASQVFTRWLSQARWRDANGAPRVLPRTGPKRSFEVLAREVSSDVHPRTLLDELLRLGLVRLDGENVVVDARAFVPLNDRDELNRLFVANAGDHLAAAVRNLSTDEPKLLEQSVFADGLSEVSAQQLGEVARRLWAQSFDSMIDEIAPRVAADADTPQPQRIRFGVYYYHEPAPLADGDKR